jgi:putative oxidoreductase
MSTTVENSAMQHGRRSLIDGANGAICWLEQVSCETLISTPARAFIATTFWLSGRTKIEDGLTLSQSAFFLFQYEYALPLIPPRAAAYLAAYAEHLFPLLLVMGLGSRLSAGALLIMTAVIQMFVYPGAWSTHLLWASALTWIIFRGPGSLSVDYWIRRRYQRQTTAGIAS